MNQESDQLQLDLSFPPHEEAVEQIVRLVNIMLHNLDTQEVGTAKSMLSRSKFQTEFETLRISMPRRMGHTTAAMWMCFYYYAFVVVPRQLEAADFIRRTTHTYGVASPERVVAASSFDSDSARRVRNSLRGAPPELIVVDGYQRVGFIDQHNYLDMFINDARRYYPSIKGIVLLQ